MIEIYLTESSDIYEKLNEVLSKKIKGKFEILRSENGKPYIEGNPYRFSLSHSEEYGMFAISDHNIGIDFERYYPGMDKKFTHILSRLTLNERMLIGSSEVRFLENWTCKEAYIKYIDSTLAHCFNRLESTYGDIYFDGEKQDCKTMFYITPQGVFSVCIAKSYIKELDGLTINNLIDKE